MVSIQQLVRGLAAFILLQPGLASNADKQHSLGTKSKAPVSTLDGRACLDAFNVTMHIPPNVTSGDMALPVTHKNGILYTTKDKEPTHWTVKRLENGRYKIYHVHPSGTKQYWTSGYDDVIALTSSEYSAKELSFAQVEESDSPLSKTTLFWDEKCLVAPNSPAEPVKMFELTACDPVILEVAESAGWKTLDDVCEKQPSVNYYGNYTPRPLSNTSHQPGVLPLSRWFIFMYWNDSI